MFVISYLVGVTLMFSGMFSVFFHRKQLMLTLLSLEFVVLGGFMGLILILSILGKFFSVSVYFLVMGACEASLGLALLVVMTRAKGSDMLHLLSFVKC